MTNAEIYAAARALVEKHGVMCIELLRRKFCNIKMNAELLYIWSKLTEDMPDGAGQNTRYYQAAKVVYEAALLAARAQERERCAEAVDVLLQQSLTRYKLTKEGRYNERVLDYYDGESDGLEAALDTIRNPPADEGKEQDK